MHPDQVQILACRYVSDELMAKVHARVLAETGQTLPTLDVYPGSIKRQCFRCHNEVWVGPRQQAVLQISPSVAIACMVCAMEAAEEETMAVVQLGNPYRNTRGQSPASSSTAAPEDGGKH